MLRGIFNRVNKWFAGRGRYLLLFGLLFLAIYLFSDWEIKFLNFQGLGWHRYLEIEDVNKMLLGGAIAYIVTRWIIEKLQFGVGGNEMLIFGGSIDIKQVTTLKTPSDILLDGIPTVIYVHDAFTDEMHQITRSSLLEIAFTNFESNKEIEKMRLELDGYRFINKKIFS